MTGINRFLGVFIVSVVAVAIGGGCCGLNSCCTTSIGVGDCTSCYDDCCDGCVAGPQVGGGCCDGGWYGGWHGGPGGWDGYGTGGCGPWTPGCRPVLGLLRMVGQAIFCGVGGCGGVYWGEWLGDPPDCQDPCCFDSVCECDSCCGGGDCTNLSQRNYNWSGGGTCDGTCQGKAPRHASTNQVVRRSPRTGAPKTAMKPSRFQAGERVVEISTHR